MAGVRSFIIMDKQVILNEIKRTAEENGGTPLGRDAFLTATGIKQKDWYGKYWARWGDALREAGYSPNQMQEAYAEDDILAKLTEFIRKIGHFPVEGELRIKARNDKSFPSHTTLGRLGSKSKVAIRLVEYCTRIGGLDDVLAIAAARIRPKNTLEEPEVTTKEILGYVYLIRSSRFYKIGRSNSVGRRERELAIQLPEKATTVHVIRTDDPSGIEAYWHKRFESKRKNGEWFELSAQDVAAFKRRKFM